MRGPLTKRAITKKPFDFGGRLPNKVTSAHKTIWPMLMPKVWASPKTGKLRLNGGRLLLNRDTHALKPA